MAKKRPFSDVFKKYKHYDDSQGRGSVAEWGDAFNARMGFDEAKARVGKNDPLSKLGLSAMPTTLGELKNVYRRVMKAHSHCFLLNASKEDQDIAKDLIAAYTVLEARFK